MLLCLAARLALSSASLASPPDAVRTYELRQREVPVGRVEIRLRSVEGGYLLEYRSEAKVRRGPALVQSRAQARYRLDGQLRILDGAASRTEAGWSKLEVKVEPGAQKRVCAHSGEQAWSCRPLEAAAIPSSLALALLGGPAQRCVEVLEETTGEQRQVCGRGQSDQIEGELCGQRFNAEMDGPLPRTLWLPDTQTRFVARAVVEFPDPPDLFSRGARLKRPLGAGAARLTGYDDSGAPRMELVLSSSALPARDQPLPRFELRDQAPEWRELLRRAVEPKPAGRFALARSLCAAVASHIEDDTPFAGEGSAEQVRRLKRGSCRGHTVLFLDLAARLGLPARRVTGLVSAEGGLFGHEWAEVEVGGAWFAVDPTEGEAPARAPRVALARGSDAIAQREAGEALARAFALSWELSPSPRSSIGAAGGP